MSDTTKGVWMLYDWDMGYRLELISTEVEPLIREVAQRGYGKVGWLPFDTDLQIAAKAWESQEPLDIHAFKVGWKDPAPVNERDYEALAKMFGVSIDEWQAKVLAYFMGDVAPWGKGKSE